MSGLIFRTPVRGVTRVEQQIYFDESNPWHKLEQLG